MNAKPHIISKNITNYNKQQKTHHWIAKRGWNFWECTGLCIRITHCKEVKILYNIKPRKNNPNQPAMSMTLAVNEEQRRSTFRQWMAAVKRRIGATRRSGGKERLKALSRTTVSRWTAANNGERRRTWTADERRRATASGGELEQRTRGGDYRWVSTDDSPRRRTAARRGCGHGSYRVVGFNFILCFYLTTRLKSICKTVFFYLNIH